MINRSTIKFNTARARAMAAKPSEPLKVGDRAYYRGDFGSGPAKLVMIVGIDEKDGRTVYDCDDGHWGYEDQFRRV